MNNLYCEKCTLQFDKEYVFDLHLSSVHGEIIAVKSEPQICEEKFEGNQKYQEDFSDHVMNNQPKVEICDFTFKTKQNLKTRKGRFFFRRCTYTKIFNFSICHSCEPKIVPELLIPVMDSYKILVIL